MKGSINFALGFHNSLTKPSATSRSGFFIFMTIVKRKWECSPFGPPESPGVYCIIAMNPLTHTKQLLYIGSAKNIHRRVMNTSHPYRQALNDVTYPVIVCVKFKECDNYLDLEKRLIIKLKPIFNIKHARTGYMSYQIKL